jgi:hypothetical protein
MVLVRKDEPPTALAIGPDGTVYANLAEMKEASIKGRPKFHGWSLRRHEIRKLAQMHTLCELRGVVAATDGRVYADERWMHGRSTMRRHEFVGYAMKPMERLFAVAELHRLAANVAILAEDALREYRKAMRARHSKPGRVKQGSQSGP